MGEAAQDTNLMDDLAAAWDEIDEEIVDEPTNEPELSESPADSGDTSDRSENDDAEPADTAVVSGEKEPDTEGKTELPDDDKPPVGLSPQAREDWKTTPESVRKEIAKRENDYAAGIEKHRANTQRVQQMDKTLQPFQQLFAMNGGAGQTLPNLLQVASQLQMGSAPQKAQTVANLIKQFGVDINTLDSMLVGEAPPPEQTQQQNVQQLVDQRFQQQEQYRQQQQAQVTQQQVGTEVQQFAVDPKNEFYNDVKMDMADLMDMAARRNQAMSMEQAYERAIQMHPQISQIVSARTSQQTVTDKRRAATSISGSPGGPGGDNVADSVRDALSDAWENAGRT